MRVLLTNDDGIYADGIKALAAALCQEHEVVIAAPDTERSGAAHSFTMRTPLRMERVTLSKLPNMEAYAINGTPADCVKLALCRLNKPDMVLSGINHGQNLGTDTSYSGTVCAALESALLGVPAMAVSLTGRKFENFDAAARVARDMLAKESGQMLLNINVPDLPYEQIKGVRYAPLANQIYDGAYCEREDPFGAKYFWPAVGMRYAEQDQNSDICCVRAGYVAVTPLILDYTDYAGLAALQKKNVE
ncbi:MAG: 5'/3'-nucleotidase SurE [Christensenellaceae bacterium]|jgi:5'-nucleotidase|nr:5'/3'-nucleotidase SurE [Christensenellaceae bacterium]